MIFFLHAWTAGDTFVKGTIDVTSPARLDDFKTNPTPFKVVLVGQEQPSVDDLYPDLEIWKHSNARRSGP